MMANSKGSPQAAGRTEAGVPAASGTVGPQRQGWARWRPYTAAVVAVGVVFGISAVIGAHVRESQITKVKSPTGVPSTMPLAIPVSPTVPVTLTVYEDLRNPQSKAFAAQYADAFTALLATGQVKIEYRLVTEVDAKDGGHGSAMAANAAACAQDQGSKQFEDYVKELWKYQPPVTKDSFASEAYLEKLGRKVHKLDASEFVPCIHSVDHEGWVTASQKDYVAAGLGDVPVLQINDRTVAPLKENLTPAKLTVMVRQAAEAAVQAADSGTPTPSAAPSGSAAAAAPAASPAAPAAVASRGSSPSPAAR